MPDMLVRLYDLPALDTPLRELAANGVRVQRVRAPEKARVVGWVAQHFRLWAAEVDVAIGRLPVACFIAVRDHEILGFACHDAIAPDFFGPTGVLEAERGRGIGGALLLASLHALREEGYGYAIIGGAGPTAFYEKTVGATIIEGSDPGILGELLL